MITPPKIRFMRFVEPMTEGKGCWEWTGALRSKNPQLAYGSFRLYTGYSIKAHRAAYLLFVGSIPTNLHVLHSCDNPSCVKPEHLRLGTHVDNMADVRKRKRNVNRFKKRSHCSQGHTYTVESTYTYPNGNRECRICRRVNQKARRNP